MRPVPWRYLLIALSTAAIVLGVVAHFLPASADSEMPRVDFNSDNIGPREIEDLTSKSIPRDYAFAWQTMAQALSENRPGLLDGYFTGLAKQDLMARVESQVKSGLHTRLVDRGHKLNAIFYAPAGDAMQLRDRVQLDMQVLDGGKVIYEEPLTLTYAVIMSPGADRWMVRQLQAIPGEKP
jgi:hypothetical protein